MTLTCGSCGHEHEFVRGDHEVPYGDAPEWDQVAVMTRADSRRTTEAKVARCCKCGYRTWRDADGIQRIMTTSAEEINEVDLFYRMSEMSERDKLRKLST